MFKEFIRVAVCPLLLAAPQVCQAAGYWLSGAVRDISGAAIPGARVQAQQGAERREATTNGAGEFRLSGLAAGQWRVRVQAPNFAAASREVTLPEASPSLFVLDVAPLAESLTVTASEDGAGKSARDPFRDVLDLREVRESSARDAGEALARVDGLWMLRKGAIANDVVLRGLQSGNVNVLVDGARIYGACPGHMDPPVSHVDFAEIERIEVVKGAYDVAYQGSLGGAVHIVRKRPAPGYHVTPSLAAGSFGYWNPSLTASWSGDPVTVSAGYSYRRSEPFRDGGGRLMTAVGGYRPQHEADEAFSVNSGWGAIRLSPGDRHTIELSYAHQDSQNVLYPYLLMDAPYDVADRLEATYRVREVGGSIRALRAQSYYSVVRHWMTDEKRLTSEGALDRFSMASFAASRVLGGRIEAEWRRGWTFGAEGYQRNWNVMNSMRTRMSVADTSLIPNVNTTVAGGFADYRRGVTDRLRIAGGARLDTAKMYVRDRAASTALWQAYKNTDQTSRRDTNPSANFRVNFRVADGWDLFAGAGSTVRAPDAQERFLMQKRMGSDRSGNPLLAPTRNTEYTVGLNAGSGALYVKPVVFYSRLSGLVVMHQQWRVAQVTGMLNPYARSFANADARLYGYEVSYGAPLGPHLLLSGGAAYVRASKDTDAALRIFSSSVPEMPPLRVRSALRLTRQLWFAEVEGVASGRQDRVDTDLGEMPAAGYALANARAGFRFGRISATASVENLFDRLHYQHLSYMRDLFRSGARLPEPGRGVFLNLLYAF